MSEESSQRVRRLWAHRVSGLFAIGLLVYLANAFAVIELPMTTTESWYAAAAMVAMAAANSAVVEMDAAKRRLKTHDWN